MNVHLHALGCRLNEAELAAWSRDLLARGHRLVDRPADAGLVILNSCAVTSQAARRSRQLVRRMHRQAPSARLVLTGCYAALEPEAAAAQAGVDRVVDNADKDRLLEEISDLLDAPGMPALAAEPGDAYLFAGGRTRAFVKIQDGCRNRCTFCVVTVARGVERSRTPDDLVTELRHLGALGYREAVLSGVHIGGYGRDIDRTLTELVQTLLDKADLPRIRLGSLEPWDLSPGFFGLWADPRLCPHLHLPLQSGSDPVLKRMARRCSTDSYRALAATARQKIPDLTLTTDVIVGFPGETDAEFQATLDFVREIGFAHVHLFTYSPRPGTRAATLPGQLPRDVKRERGRALAELAEQMKHEALQRAVGQVRPVLWEEREQGGERASRPASPSAEPTKDTQDTQGGDWVGYTDNYLRVTARSGQELKNRILPARLLEVEGQRLRGAVQSSSDPASGAGSSAPSPRP